MAIKRITTWIKPRLVDSSDTRSVSPSRRALRIGEVLLDEGLINEQQLRLALERQRELGGFLGEIIVVEGFASAEIVGKHLSKIIGFEYADLSSAKFDPTVARRLDDAFLRRKRIIPIREDSNEIEVAMSDPLDVGVVDEIRARLNRPINATLAFGQEIDRKLDEVFTIKHKSESLIEEIQEFSGLIDSSEDDLLALAGEGPIVRLVNNILESAVRQGASDIHIEPHETQVRVRYRVDGLLYEQMLLPRANHAAVVSRIKIVSHLNIAERRRPQDGRFVVRGDKGSPYDVRVSTANTVFGEKIVMRLLEKDGSIATISNVGFLPDQETYFNKIMKRPYGVVLITGPTGSGKSTTMFAGLSAINDPNINISTVEDPVEYHLAGANQINVNHKIGVTFATGLRTLVRQDPDVIMVGEIRDSETAEIGIQAALTGHLVLSTLHTNNAPGALIRLQNMGIEPYLVSSAVIGVVGQRLLRTVCQACSEQYPAPDEVIEEFGLPMNNGKTPLLNRGKGCPRCNGRGMKGRTAVFEVMPMSEGIRELVIKRANTDDIMDLARSEGMTTMRQAGIKKLLAGETTPDEILRVLSTGEEQ